MALVGLLFIIALWDIGKTAVKHARDDYGKSRAGKVKKAEKEAAPASLTPPQRKTLVRRHATGYWLGEILARLPRHPRGMAGRVDSAPYGTRRGEGPCRGWAGPSR